MVFGDRFDHRRSSGVQYLAPPICNVDRMCVRACVCVCGCGWVGGWVGACVRACILLGTEKSEKIHAGLLNNLTEQ